MSSTPILTDLPLFPLHAVLFPGGVLPLRIFEPRYLQMVRKCLSTGSPFGVVTLNPGSEVQQPAQLLERFHPIGTVAHIDTITYHNNGLALLRCSGHGRFRVQEARLKQQGLWVGDVALLPNDQTTPIPQDLLPAAQALAKVRQKQTASGPLPKEAPAPQHLSIQPRWVPEHLLYQDCGWVANRWCELLPMKQALRLQLLELDSPLVRLELICDALERTGILP